MSSFAKNFLIVVVGLFLTAMLLSNLIKPEEKPEEVDIGAFITHIKEREVATIDVKPESYEFTLVQPEVAEEENATSTEETAAPLFKVEKEVQETFGEVIEHFDIDPAIVAGIEINVKRDRGFAFWLLNIGPWLFPIFLLVILGIYMFRQVSGANNKAMGFGQSMAREVLPGKDGSNQITFKEVAGNQEPKEELEEIVDFLKEPKKFSDAGAKIPRGVLLMGPPGTGKTLLARAVAGEANVPFLHISGSEFVEMFVGVGASRVRDLFRRAKKLAPAIIFVDEIDAVGRRRGAGLGGSHDEREQTLNQILVEMDGFDPNSGVIVVAATNRPDVLDPALLRPGRFDRRVTLSLPDIKAREQILSIHAKGKKLAKDVKMREIAERTPGFSGADLANLLNEAAILSVRKKSKQLTKLHILNSIEKVLLGPERKSRIFSDRERKLTAFHEAGHALVANKLEHSDPVRKVSIISRGHAGGYTLKMPTEDKNYQTRAQFLDDLAVAMGGYVAEKMIFGKEFVTTGPSSDLRTATKIARRIVTEFGMSFELGPRTFGSSDEMIFLGREMTNNRDYSEKLSEKIDSEVSKFLEEAERRAEELLITHKTVLVDIAEALLRLETLEQADFEKIVAGEKVEAPAEEKEEKKKEEEKEKKVEAVISGDDSAVIPSDTSGDDSAVIPSDTSVIPSEAEGSLKKNKKKELEEKEESKEERTKETKEGPTEKSE